MPSAQSQADLLASILPVSISIEVGMHGCTSAGRVAKLLHFGNGQTKGHMDMHGYGPQPARSFCMHIELNG